MTTKREPNALSVGRWDVRWFTSQRAWLSPSADDMREFIALHMTPSPGIVWSMKQ